MKFDDIIFIFINFIMMIHSSSVVPFSLNEICGDQEFNKNILQEIIDDHVFNGIILRGNYQN